MRVFALGAAWVGSGVLLGSLVACGGRVSYEEPAPTTTTDPSQPAASGQGGAPSSSVAGSAGNGLAGSFGLAGNPALAGNGGSGGSGMPGHPTPRPPKPKPNPDPIETTPPIDHETWDTTGVYSSDADQAPGASACGVCAANEVCHPGVGCELACDITSGLDADAAWPVGGGCATRRGLSRYRGLVAPQRVFTLGLGAEPGDYSSALTLGSDRTIYVPAYDAYQSRQGYLRISKDGSTLLIDESYDQVPVVTSDTLYTAPGGLRAVDLDGNLRWDSVTGVADGDGPSNQSGEPVVGADGTIYAGGFVGDQAALFAVAPNGAVIWSAITGGNSGLASWPAVSIDGTIYFGDSLDPDGGNRLWAISPAGKLLWHASVGGYSWSFPAVAHDGNVYVANGAELWSFTPAGTLRWHYTQPHTEDQSFVFTHVAIGIDGTLFVPFFDQGGSLGENSGVVAFSSGGTQLWSFSQSGYGVSTPVVDRDGNVFFATTNTLHAFTPKGDTLWAQTIDDANYCSGIALGAEGTTYALCDSALYGFRDTAP